MCLIVSSVLPSDTTVSPDLMDLDELSADISVYWMVYCNDLTPAKMCNYPNTNPLKDGGNEKNLYEHYQYDGLHWYKEGRPAI